ncbi:MAG: leucine-rich repeat protein [Clostridia bacterium]|nr:leucine-rich repeat protein [Clostridia bacterium]
MKSQAQILLFSLAVTFAFALALTVALLCLSYLREGNASRPAVSTTAEEDLPIYHPSEEGTTTAAPPVTTAPPAPQTQPPKVGNGLVFDSNGNGTCVLTGLGDCNDACVVIPEYAPNGDRVTEIADRVFFEATSVTAVQIPAGVERIGSLAFAACKNLVYLSVDANNPYYCDVDGVLYSADKQTLLQYPPMRAGSTATILRSVTEIKEMAFYDCTYLRSILYAGSAEEWEQIRIGSKNYSLTAASKTFGATGK